MSYISVVRVVSVYTHTQQFTTFKQARWKTFLTFEGHGCNKSNYPVKSRQKNKTIIARVLFLSPSKISTGYTSFGYFRR